MVNKIVNEANKFMNLSTDDKVKVIAATSTALYAVGYFIRAIKK